MTLDELIKNAAWFEKIRALRAIKNWSQDQTAEKCGTCKRLYWNWENGKHYPAKHSRKMIAAAFGVPEQEIFGK